MGYLYYSNVKSHLEHNTEILKVISLTAYHKNDIEHDKDYANPRINPRYPIYQKYSENGE